MDIQIFGCSGNLNFLGKKTDVRNFQDRVNRNFN
jgi:hypothetical protein